MPSLRKPVLQGPLAILLAALLWSSGGLFIKVAPLPGLLVAGGRAVVTSVFYLALLRPDLRKARWSTALVYAGMILTFVTATKLTTAANAILLQYTGTAWVMALGPRLLGEPLRRVDIATVLACLGGMALCVLDHAGTASAPRPILGNALAAVSGLFFAGTVLAMRRDARPDSPVDAQASTTLGNLVAVAIALPLAHQDLALLWNRDAMLVLLWLGVVQMGVAYLLFLRGVRTVPAATASLLALVEPAANPLWVFLGTGERPGVTSVLGGVIVLGALGLRSWWLGRT
jgi:DME family drug/metabolite transporter